MRVETWNRRIISDMNTKEIGMKIGIVNDRNEPEVFMKFSCNVAEVYFTLDEAEMRANQILAEVEKARKLEKPE